MSDVDCSRFRRLYLPAALLCLSLLPTRAHAATYYVAKGGSDSTSCGAAQSASSPRGTINQGIACLSGGDTLVIGDGVYDEVIADLPGWQGMAVRPPNGSAGAYTTLKAQHRRRAILRYTRSYGENNALVTLEHAQYLAFEGLVLDKQANAARLTRGFLLGSPHAIRFVDMEFAHGQGGAGGGTQIEVRHCDQHGAGYDYAGQDVCTGCDGVTHCPGYCHGYYLQGGSGWLFDGGTIRHNSGYGVQYGSQVTIRNVRFDTLLRGAVVSHTPVTAYNNLIVNTQGGFLVPAGSVILHNSFLRAGTVLGTGDGTIANNIVVDSDARGMPTAHNLIGGDPRWVAPPTDLHLQAGSPAIGMGRPVPPEMQRDKDGSPRTGRVDVGAYQYGSQGPSGRPDPVPPPIATLPAPRNVRVIPTP